MTFSISLLVVLRSTMGRNALGVSYDASLGFRIITDMDFLKWLGQCSV